MYPGLNLLSLDMDAGASEVNILNRLHIMVAGAREKMAGNKITNAEKKENHTFFMPPVWSDELCVLKNHAKLDIEKWRSWVSGLGLIEKNRHI